MTEVEDNAVARSLSALVTGVVENGVGPLTGSVTYAHARLRDDRGEYVDPEADKASFVGTPEAETAIQRIIRESVAAAGTQGLITGLGGFIVLPITLPANIAGNLIVNARMVGAIAHLRGYNLHDPHTQAMLMLVVAGSSAQSATATIGMKVGQQLTKQTIKAIPISAIREINKRAGFMLLAKYGTKRAPITLVKGVPLIGGLVSGGVDATLTSAIAKTAKKAFPSV